ncbi:hypothetical protein L208DRAFT_1385036, partial [Tricholoma matsutake]
MEHIHKYWGQGKLESILKEAKEMYKQCYLEMYSNGSTLVPARRTGKSAMHKVGVLIHELSDDDDDSNDGIKSCASPITPSELSAPWCKDFFGYLNSMDQLGNMTIVEWWGCNTTQYDVWVSLACDMLPIMASSVSSECAFSSVGITITK